VRQEELTVERLAKSGDGVAHVGGRTVFVEGALPGERVRVNVTEAGRVLRGELVEILQPSPDRRVPGCSIADRCGGCDWLHVSEEVQRSQKVEIVLSALEHLGGFERTGFKLLPTVCGTQPLGYRRRAVLHPVGKRFGFFGRGSHDKVEVEQCPALTGPLQALPTKLADALGTAIKDVAQVHLLEAGGKIAISLHLKDTVKAKTREKAEAISRGGIGVVLVPPAGHSESFGKVELQDGAVRVRPDAFVQANAEVNAKLVTAAAEALALDGTQSVLELYAGNGNFTFELAKKAAQVLAVESSPISLQLAQKAAGEVKNVRFVQGDALKILEGLVKEGQKFDRVLVDPPRTGAPGLGMLASKTGATRLVYVACDPAALARDAEELFAHGFRPLSLQLFDLFPQTRHVEAVLAMER
jgi:23S rRNA (uracil1939-C5)-methyltransferase